MTRSFRFAPCGAAALIRLATLACLFALQGCGGTNVIGQQKPRVRLFDAVDGAQLLQATWTTAAGSPAGSSSAAFGAASAPPDAALPAGNAVATFSAAGAPLFQGGSELYRINSTYTAYAGGVPGKYVVLVLPDTTIGGAKSRVQIRLAHVGANVPAVDAYLVPAGTTIGQGSAPILSDVAFGSASDAGSGASTDANGYAKETIADRASYTIVVTAHGSLSPIAQVTAPLYATVYYTLAVFDQGNGAGATLLSDFR